MEIDVSKRQNDPGAGGRAGYLVDLTRPNQLQAVIPSMMLAARTLLKGWQSTGISVGSGVSYRRRITTEQ